MGAPLIFIGGGARSGKSAHGLNRARGLGKRILFIATAEARDGEMGERIRRHREERGAEFVTLEVPMDLPGALREPPECDGILVDCLTLWISNLLCADLDDGAIEGRIDELFRALETRTCPIVIVSNEVGLGIVPEHALARRFRDLVGRAHQGLAARADEVVFGALGMLLRLKPGPIEGVTP